MFQNHRPTARTSTQAVACAGRSTSTDDNTQRWLRNLPTMHAVTHRPDARPDKADLLAQLKTGPAQQRRQAAEGLVAFPDSAAMLGARLAVETDDMVRTTLLASLGQLNSEAAAGALLALLQDRDHTLSSACVTVLARMPSAVSSCMQTRLQDIDADVRMAAITWLARLPHPDVPTWLAQVLATDQAADCVAAAVEAAALLGSAELAPALLAARERFPADTCLHVAVDMAIAGWQTGQTR